LNDWFISRGISDNSLSNKEKYNKLVLDNSVKLSLIELYSTSKLSAECHNEEGKNFDDHPSNWEGIQRPRFEGRSIQSTMRIKEECPGINDWF